MGEIKADILFHVILVNPSFICINKIIFFFWNQDAGISKQLIFSDLWILRYSPKILKSRIDSVHQAGVPAKPWLLRCKRSIFEKLVHYCKCYYNL